MPASKAILARDIMLKSRLISNLLILGVLMDTEFERTLIHNNPKCQGQPATVDRQVDKTVQQKEPNRS